MSIDNNAILFIGKVMEEVDLNKLLKIDGITQDVIDSDDLQDSLYYNCETVISICAIYDEDGDTIGIEVGDSGSYSCIEYHTVYDIVGKIKDAREKFFDIFEIEPVVYLFNQQW